MVPLVLIVICFYSAEAWFRWFLFCMERGSAGFNYNFFLFCRSSAGAGFRWFLFCRSVVPLVSILKEHGSSGFYSNLFLFCMEHGTAGFDSNLIPFCRSAVSLVSILYGAWGLLVLVLIYFCSVGAWFRWFLFRYQRLVARWRNMCNRIMEPVRQGGGESEIKEVK